MPILTKELQESSELEDSQHSFSSLMEQKSTIKETEVETELSAGLTRKSSQSQLNWVLKVNMLLFLELKLFLLFYSQLMLLNSKDIKTSLEPMIIIDTILLQENSKDKKHLEQLNWSETSMKSPPSPEISIPSETGLPKTQDPLSYLSTKEQFNLSLVMPKKLLFLSTLEAISAFL